MLHWLQIIPLPWELKTWCRWTVKDWCPWVKTKVIRLLFILELPVSFHFFPWRDYKSWGDLRKVRKEGEEWRNDICKACPLFTGVWKIPLPQEIKWKNLKKRMRRTYLEKWSTSLAHYAAFLKGRPLWRNGRSFLLCFMECLNTKHPHILYCGSIYLSLCSLVMDYSVLGYCHCGV